MARLPPSVSIALWFVGSSTVVAVLALFFDISSAVVMAAVVVGAGAAIFEWNARKRS